MSASVAHAGADLRLIRAAVFTAVCVALSAGGHVLASGVPVPLWTLGVGCAAVFAVAAPLAGRERSLPGIAAALALGQLVLHLLFGLGQHGTAAADPTRSPGSDNSLIALAGKLLCHSGPPRVNAAEAHRIIIDAGIDPAAHVAGTTPGREPALLETLPLSLSVSLPMALAHLLAALAAGWLLRRGEVALWRLVRLATDEVGAVRALPTALRLAAALCAGLFREEPAGDASERWTDGLDERAPRGAALQHSVVRRGPPRYDLAA